MTINKEDFEQWRAHPVTEAVSLALQKLAERNRQVWIDTSWGGGEANPLTLSDLKARAEMAQDLSELTFEELSEVLDDESKRHKNANGIQGADPAG